MPQLCVAAVARGPAAELAAAGPTDVVGIKPSAVSTITAFAEARRRELDAGIDRARDADVRFAAGRRYQKPVDRRGPVLAVGADHGGDAVGVLARPVAAAALGAAEPEALVATQEHRDDVR